MHPKQKMEVHLRTRKGKGLPRKGYGPTAGNTANTSSSRLSHNNGPFTFSF